jgi:hypothetical protein
MINRFLVLLTGLMVSSMALSGHHKESEKLAPVASAGQVVVVYEVPCKNVVAGLASIKDLIAYEVKASPISYSSSPATIGEGVIGAVDLHLSVASMQNAVSWQESDAKWKAMQAKSLEACGVTADDIKATIILAE